MTLLLSGADVAALMRPADWLAAAEAGFAAVAAGRAFSPAPMAIEAKGGGFHAKGASLGGERPYVALKLNANFPGNPPLRPTIQGAVLLCDGENGALLAVIDSIEVTLRRTAAASALAARHLARPDSRSLLVCGCGAQAGAQIEALADVLLLRRGYAWDRDFARAEAVAGEARARGLEMTATRDLGEAAAASDVVVACTTARLPFLAAGAVRPGAFVAAVGADSPDKNEVDPGLMAAARVVVDSLDQCLAMGDLRHAVRAGAMQAGDVHAALAQVVVGEAPGRASPDQIFVFDSTGTAVQDVAAAAAIYERARARGDGRAFDFAKAA